jgi:O-antigen ligase
MAVHLFRSRPIVVPPGFGLWALFLAWVVLSSTMLGVDPPGVVAEPASSRLLGVAFYLAGYGAATVILLYAGNLPEEVFPLRRLVRQLGGLFVVVVAGGLLGLVWPTFELTSLVEVLLPQWMASHDFVRSLVHPVGAQLHDVLGYVSPRPAAPFGYTNTWGNCLVLLLGFFVVSWFSRTSPARRLVGGLVAAAAAIPVVYSLNRGVWIGLGLVLLVTVVRLAARGRRTALAALGLTLCVSAVVVVASPLTSVIQSRLDNPHSNSIRTFTTEQTLEAVAHSPVLGLGSTRAALGSSNSIAVGETPSCQRCGNPVLGSNGQIWLVLIAQGYVGVVLFTGFFAFSVWHFRGDRTPTGDAALLGAGLPLFFMFIYNAVTVPLIIAFLSIAVLWRNQRNRAAEDAVPVDPARSRSEGSA